MTETATVASKEPRRLVRGLLWSGAAILVAVTVYLSTMTVLWGLHVNSLRSTIEDLSDELADSASTLLDKMSQLEASQYELDLILDSIVESANLKAESQDFQLLFLDIAEYMDDCATEAGELVGYVYDRAQYQAWSLFAYEDEVREYYREILKAFNSLVDEMEEEL